MPDPITDTPTSPPARPVIPRGYATKLGELTAALAVLAAAAFAIFDVELEADELAPLIGALATVITVIAGRMAQAKAAIIADAPAATALEYVPEHDAELEDDAELELEEPAVEGNPDRDACEAVIGEEGRA